MCLALAIAFLAFMALAPGARDRAAEALSRDGGTVVAKGTGDDGPYVEVEPAGDAALGRWRLRVTQDEWDSLSVGGELPAGSDAVARAEADPYGSLVRRMARAVVPMVAPMLVVLVVTLAAYALRVTRLSRLRDRMGRRTSRDG